MVGSEVYRLQLPYFVTIHCISGPSLVVFCMDERLHLYEALANMKSEEKGKPKERVKYMYVHICMHTDRDIHMLNK